MVNRWKLIISAPQLYAERFANAARRKNAEHPLFDIHTLPLVKVDVTGGAKAIEDRYKEWSSQSDILVFCSRHAITSFIQAKRSIDLSQLSKKRAFAIGKDAELLQSEFPMLPLYPQRESSLQGIISTLTDLPEVKQQTIAVFAPQMRGMDEPLTMQVFMERLVPLCRYVIRIPAYEVCSMIDEQEQQLVSLAGQHTVVAFTSGMEIQCFADYLSRHPDLLHSYVFSCYGPYTAQTAHQKQLPVSLVSTAYSSFEEYVDVLWQHFSL